MAANARPSGTDPGDDDRDSEQGALFAIEGGKKEAKPRGRRPAGRHERALGTALRAARLTGKHADPVKAALNAAGVSLCRALACQLDKAEDDRRGIYATPQLAGQYRDALQALGLLGKGGDGGDDDGLGDLGTPTLEHTTDT